MLRRFSAGWPRNCHRGSERKHLSRRHVRLRNAQCRLCRRKVGVVLQRSFDECFERLRTEHAPPVARQIPADGKSLSGAGGILGGDGLRWQRLRRVAADVRRWRSFEVRAYGATRDKRYRDNGTATAQQVSPKPKPPDRPPRPLNHTPNPGPWLCSRRLRRAEGRPRPPLNKIVSRTLFARRPVRHEPEPRRPDVAILQRLLFCFCNACLPALYFLTSDAVLPPGVPPTASAPPSDGQAPDTRAARLPRGPRTHLNRGRPKQPHRARYR